MPKIHESVYVAQGAVIIGDVTIGENSGVWYHTTIRGDRAGIEIGKETNIQDNTVIHEDINNPVKIGNGVTVGHGAIIHGCNIGDNTLVGMGAILLNGASVGKNCIIGAGALITQNTMIPDNSLVVGSPARIIRSVTEEEIKKNLENARAYKEEAAIAKQV